jgi:hypothetical protein
VDPPSSPIVLTQTPTPAPTAAPTAAPIAATPVPTVAATPVPTPDPTPEPTPELTPTPTPKPTPEPTPKPTPTPTPAPVSGSSIRVTSIPALLTALADNDITEIVVANGTYRVSPAGLQRSDSLWIGKRFAGRTKSVVVRAETNGGVVFDGGGANYFGGIWFVDGAHHQTWQGFVFANGTPTQTGVIMFGDGVGRAAPHHITLRSITIPRSIRTSSTGAGDHGVYFSQAVGGPHDLLIDGLTVDGAGGLDTALHFYHSDSSHRNAWNVTIRRMKVTGTDQAIMLWDSTTSNVLIEDSTISGATSYAVSYERGSAITFRGVTSSGSGSAGWTSSKGANPPGVTFIDTVLR